jgi:F-type H+-transporting ATPase subunit a
MNLSPDDTIVGHLWLLKINLTILTTWGILLFLTISAYLLTRKLVPDIHISQWQGFIEMLVLGIKKQIEEIGIRRVEPYVGFLGSLFIFLAASTLFSIIPSYRAPTSSLSTTTALALCVFLSVLGFGIAKKGFLEYFKDYLKPTVLMLPFNIISEFSRTFALAIRLFGNMMSGELLVSILVTLTPLLFPMIMNALGLLIGMVQAYIFTILATVYIAAAIQIQGETDG